MIYQVGVDVSSLRNNKGRQSLGQAEAEPVEFAPWALKDGLRVGQTVRYLGKDNVIGEATITNLVPRMGREENWVGLDVTDEQGCAVGVFPTAILDPEDKVLLPGMKVHTLHVTYDISTRLSVEEGDFAECGSEDLIVLDVGEDPVDEVFHHLRRMGTLEASCSPFQPGAWYREVAQEREETCSGEMGWKTRSYHLGGFTAEEEVEVNRRLRELRVLI